LNWTDLKNGASGSPQPPETKNGAACCRRKRKTEQPAAAGNAWKSGKGPVQTVKDFPQEK